MVGFGFDFAFVWQLWIVWLPWRIQPISPAYWVLGQSSLPKYAKWRMPSWKEVRYRSGKQKEHEQVPFAVASAIALGRHAWFRESAGVSRASNY